MLTLDDVVDDATGKQWYREQFRHPEFVERVLNDYQFEALAGVLKYPQLSKECTAHILSTADGFYVDCYRAWIASRNCIQGTVTRLLAKGWGKVYVDELVALICFPTTLYRARHSIGRARNIVEWRYRQQKRAA